MAIDTDTRKFSAINIGCPWRGVNAFPTGALDDPERFALLYLYNEFAGAAAGSTLSANPRWFPLVLAARLSWLRRYTGLAAAAATEAAGTAGWAKPKLYGNIEVDVHSVPSYQRPGWGF